MGVCAAAAPAGKLLAPSPSPSSSPAVSGTPGAPHDEGLTVTLKQDARLAKPVTLEEGIHTATEWGETLKKQTSMTVVWPKSTSEKKVLIQMAPVSLKTTLDALGRSLRLQWKLKGDEIRFEPLPSESVLDDLNAMLPQNARDLLELGEEERGLRQFQDAGKIIDGLNGSDWASLKDGQPVDINQLSGPIQKLAWDLWLIPNLADPSHLPLFTPQLANEGKYKVWQNGNRTVVDLYVGDELKMHREFLPGSPDLPFDPKTVPLSPP